MPLFIECSLGYYGYNCNQSCDGCLSRSCDDYGDCTDGTGCNPGWQLGEMKCDRGIKTNYQMLVLKIGLFNDINVNVKLLDHITMEIYLRKSLKIPKG
jgi:hypothetical protein